MRSLLVLVTAVGMILLVAVWAKKGSRNRFRHANVRNRPTLSPQLHIRRGGFTAYDSGSRLLTLNSRLFQSGPKNFIESGPLDVLW